ncbi:transposable element Tcb2 transposase [Trichonephila clavipes]|nr:transposable element Tcb2 transposase [Trichonephila clavipes]
MPLRRFRRQYEQLSQFETGRIIGIMEAGWSTRRVARQLGLSDCVVMKCWNQWISERCHLLEDQAHDASTNQSSRRRPHRKEFTRTANCFIGTVAPGTQHTAPTAGVMVWGAIAYSTRSLLVLIRSTRTAQRYIHNFLQPHVLPLIQRLPGAIFQQDHDRHHTAKVSEDCHRTVTTLLWLDRSPDLSPIEHIWDHLGRRVGHPTSLRQGYSKLGTKCLKTSFI